MINFTVKTLDSNNYQISVEDEITIQELKRHIEEKVGISAQFQRLIFCGRVMLDDKPLSEYNVDGKVVHLVQRAPPTSEARANNSNANASESGASSTTQFRRYTMEQMPVGQLLEDQPGSLSPTAERLDFLRQLMADIRYSLNRLRSHCERAQQRTDRPNQGRPRTYAEQEQDTLDPEGTDPELRTQSARRRAIRAIRGRNSRPRDLAQLLEELETLHEQFSRYRVVYKSMLREANSPEPRQYTDSEREHGQILVDMVTDLMHSFSHAYHIVSDINFAVGQPGPQLRSGWELGRNSVPMQGHINVMQTIRRQQPGAANANSDSANRDNNEPNSQVAASTPPESVTYQVEIETRVPIAIAFDNSAMNANQASQNSSPDDNATPLQNNLTQELYDIENLIRGLGQTGRLSDFEVLMSMEDLPAAAIDANASHTNTANQPSSDGAGGYTASVPWAGTASVDLLQNIVSSVIGQGIVETVQISNPIIGTMPFQAVTPTVNQHNYSAVNLNQANGGQQHVAPQALGSHNVGGPMNIGHPNIAYPTIGISNIGLANIGHSNILHPGVIHPNVVYPNVVHPTIVHQNLVVPTIGPQNIVHPNAPGIAIGQPNISHINIDQPNIGQANLTQPNVGQATIGQTNVGQANVGQANVAQANMGQLNVGQSNAAQQIVGQANIGLRNIGQGAMGQLNLVQAHMGQPNVGRVNIGQRPGGQQNLSGQASVVQANVAQANVAQANVAQANVAQANVAQANVAQANVAQANVAQANVAQANARSSSINQPNSGQPNIGQQNTGNVGQVNVPAFQQASVHIRRAPLGRHRGISLRHLTFFDPFLPCDNDHGRRRLERRRESVEGQQAIHDEIRTNRAGVQNILALSEQNHNLTFEHLNTVLEQINEFPSPPAWGAAIVATITRQLFMSDMLQPRNGQVLVPNEFGTIRMLTRSYVQQLMVRARAVELDSAFDRISEYLVDMNRDFLMNIHNISPVRNEIDVVASVRDMVRSNLPGILSLVLYNTNAGESHFVSRYYSLFGRFFLELCALILYYCADSQNGMRLVFTSYVSSCVRTFDESVRHMFHALYRENLNFLLTSQSELASHTNNIIDYMQLKKEFDHGPRMDGPRPPRTYIASPVPVTGTSSRSEATSSVATSPTPPKCLSMTADMIRTAAARKMARNLTMPSTMSSRSNSVPTTIVKTEDASATSTVNTQKVAPISCPNVIQEEDDQTVESALEVTPETFETPIAAPTGTPTASAAAAETPTSASVSAPPLASTAPQSSGRTDVSRRVSPPASYRSGRRILTRIANAAAGNVQSRKTGGTNRTHFLMPKIKEYWTEKWVPAVLDRDGEWQAQEEQQPPHSDAYLTGMPSRKRRCIRNARPPTAVDPFLRETFRAAMGRALHRMDTSDIREPFQGRLRPAVRAQVAGGDCSPHQYPHVVRFLDTPDASVDDEIEMMEEQDS